MAPPLFLWLGFVGFFSVIKLPDLTVSLKGCQISQCQGKDARSHSVPERMPDLTLSLRGSPDPSKIKGHLFFCAWIAQKTKFQQMSTVWYHCRSAAQPWFVLRKDTRARATKLDPKEPGSQAASWEASAQ